MSIHQFSQQERSFSRYIGPHLTCGAVPAEFRAVQYTGRKAEGDRPLKGQEHGAIRGSPDGDSFAAVT